MAQHLNHIGGVGRDSSGGSIDPNDIMSAGYGSPTFSSHNFSSPNPTASAHPFSSGAALFGDDELLDGLGSPTDHGSGLAGPGQDLGSMGDMNMAFSHEAYGSHRASTGLQLGHGHMNGYSNTPDGEPMQSPYNSHFAGGLYRQMQPQHQHHQHHQHQHQIQPHQPHEPHHHQPHHHEPHHQHHHQPQLHQQLQHQPLQHQPQNHHGQSLGTSLHSPVSYSGSPHGLADMHPDGGDHLGAKARRTVPPAMQRNPSTATRPPMTPKSSGMHPVPIGAPDGTGGFGSQPIRTASLHDKSSPAQWMQTPGGSMGASYGSAFSSPLQTGIVQINEVMMRGGTSMPAKLGMPTGAAPNATSSQEMKRKRRRESHNLVERRRRDNINERIQDLSRLVPTHRLEDEKLRKMLQNGTPLSPTQSFPGVPGAAGAAAAAPAAAKPPPQPSSALGGPGARRATAGVVAGNITTGLPVEDKDKGPNKGDILNGAVSWTRDLMWLLHLKLQQQDELASYIAELGGKFPFQVPDDERRMQTELAQAVEKNPTERFAYSRTAGTALRVPGHTDYRGDPLGSSGEPESLMTDPLGTLGPAGASSLSKNGALMAGDLDEGGWHDPQYYDDDIDLKEEDEYDMDLN